MFSQTPGDIAQSIRDERALRSPLTTADVAYVLNRIGRPGKRRDTKRAVIDILTAGDTNVQGFKVSDSLDGYGEY